ncbi:hypothetical protein MPHL43072_10615 [Mycolicibacterium phlei DSM 43072]|nr:hypothetical protein MPHL43072_10615 [Mycolicibacterium phlei DSM 43072]KXW72751.1 hypothetical protein MPHL43070_14580 [Mycolicibacterium phlei DSM 43070]
MPMNDTALSANTTVGPDTATSAPATAGPIARALFMLRLVSAAAAGICSRGTSSGWIACHAGAVSA